LVAKFALAVLNPEGAVYEPCRAGLVGEPN
jgi:hypothetical protein